MSGRIDAELRAWLNRHERHRLFYGRENGGVDVIRCSSCEDFGAAREARFYMARPASTAVGRDVR